jgi:lysyl-tRNA synthetase class 1
MVALSGRSTFPEGETDIPRSMATTSGQLSGDWLDQLVEQVVTAYPEGVLRVSSGHSPSGTYHIGTLREIMTANAITWALRRAGREAQHIDFVDDFDALRKVPQFLSDDWRKYIGTPLALIPDPYDCHKSYGAHFLASLHEGLEQLGVMPDETVFGYETYRDGLLTQQMQAALDKLAHVRAIVTETGGRSLDANWAPVQIMDDDKNLRTRKFVSWDSGRQEVAWRDVKGDTGTVAIDSGQLKLDWRLDWPARWAKWGIEVEPFGRDHATKGGSYDTGKVLVTQIFGGQAPYPVPYEFINTLGETKKMSKSVGNVLTPKDALAVMPPEILRYFVIKARPGRTLSFDAGLGFYALVDDYLKAELGPPSAAMAYAQAGSTQATIVAGLPFSHLVAVYQAARREPLEVCNILERTGYEQVVADHWPVIERELEFVKNWLAHYAPVNVKFEVQPEIGEHEFDEDTQGFFAKLADTIEREGDLNGQGMHDAIYAATQSFDMKPGRAFVALYQLILGQDSGPKAGWFLASLDRDWLLRRLRLEK